MKKINGILLLVLISLLPLISASRMIVPAHAVVSEELVGDFDGLEPGESLSYKLWMPQDTLSWMQDPNTLDSFVTIFNTSFWSSLFNATEIRDDILAIFEFIDSLLDVRLEFQITRVIQPNTTDLYPYGNVQALLNITNLNATELYYFFESLGISLGNLTDFIEGIEYYTTNVVVDLDALTLLTGQPFYPDRPANPLPNTTHPIIWHHYQPDDINPYPISKFDDYIDVALYANATNVVDTVILEHNGTGVLQNVTMTKPPFSEVYKAYNVNTTAVEFCHYWKYRFYINDTCGASNVTEWHIKHKNGTAVSLPVIMSNNFDYWAGYFDGFMTLIDLLFGLFIGYDIIQDFEFVLDQTYETSEGNLTQTHDAVHSWIDISTGELSAIIIEEVLGLSYSDIIDIWLVYSNYTDWLECFHVAPIEIDAWWETPHGFLLNGKVSLNLTHFIQKWELFLIRLLNLAGAPDYIVGNLTAAIDWIAGIGEVGIGVELAWYDEIPEPIPFFMKWWMWLLIGVGIGAGVMFAIIYAWKHEIWWFERVTVVHP